MSRGFKPYFYFGHIDGNSLDLPIKIIRKLLSNRFDTVWDHRALCDCNLVLNKPIHSISKQCSIQTLERVYKHYYLIIRGEGNIKGKRFSCAKYGRGGWTYGQDRRRIMKTVVINIFLLYFRFHSMLYYIL